jgi:hypothetical protein
MISENLENGLLPYSTVTLFARFRGLSVTVISQELAGNHGQHRGEEIHVDKGVTRCVKSNMRA